MTKPLVSAVIPCLNEEETLGICIEKVQKAFARLGIEGEVVVGDNGSTDRSVEIATSLGARVAHQEIRGYGAAIQAAVSAARGKHMIMADADDSYDWENIGPFIERLEDGADLVMGNRFRGKIYPGAMPPLHKYLGNPVLSWISKKFYRIPVGDFHCGMRGFTQKAWETMALETTGMEFATEMVVRASQENLRIDEIPINLYPDKRSHPPHLRSFRDGWRHLRFIMTFAPNYLYLLPGAVLMLIGMILQALLFSGPAQIGPIYLGTHFLALGLSFTLVGLNVIIFGLIAKAFLWRRTRKLKNHLLSFLSSHFNLERGLIGGVTVFLIGLGIDIHLLYRWLTVGGPMEESIHTAFVASGLIAAGLLIMFGSFLLQLMLSGEKH
ncbi:MAG: glycosyltransferase family 2 protein [Sedimenticola sp.]